MRIVAAAPVAVGFGCLKAKEGRAAEREKGPGSADHPRITTREVPYYSARADLYATIACARMVLGFFEPEEYFPYQDVAEMVYHREKYWTFEAQLMPILLQKGYEAELYATTPYQDMAAGKAVDGYGPDALKRIDREAVKWALGYLNEKNYRKERTSLDAAIKWFTKGDTLILAASRNLLRNQPDLPYCRYNVVITGAEKGYVAFHDPAAGPHVTAKIDVIKKAFQAPGTDCAVLRIRHNANSATRPD